MAYIDEPEMLEEQRPNPAEFIQQVTSADNFADGLEESQLAEIAAQVIEDFDMDKDSMADWLQRMERGLDLANLVKQDKSYPFDGAANIKYPLVTSAALQFNARAYPAIAAPDRVVKVKVWGSDPQGQKASRAERVSEHMSWQMSAQVEEWEAETDKLLVMLPIVGTMVRKWWFDPVEGRPRCRLVEPDKFVVNDKVKNLADAPRLSEEMPLYPGEIETRIRSGAFVQFDFDRTKEDKQELETFIEQHTRLDLDEDGYEEPYIVTVHQETRKVVRIVADFGPDDVNFETETVQETVMAQVQLPNGAVVPVPQIVPREIPTRIISIKRGSYFQDFHFLPAMDGGFHGTGLGLLLGDISDSINSIINQLIDAGHFGTLGGGFIASQGTRMKGGSMRLRPGEYKHVNANGNDLRSSIVPMPAVKPDATLFSMLGMLIDAGREIASVQDVITGDAGGRQQTATTTLALIEQGMMVFTASYKRIFRSLKGEFGLVAKMNAQTVTPEEYNAFHDEAVANEQMGHNGGPPFDPAQDYAAADMDIQPVADPRTVTKMQQAGKAQLVMQLAEMGLADRGEALNRVAEAMDIEDVEELLPKPDPMQQQMQQFSMAAAEADVRQKMADIDLTLARIEGERAGAVKDMASVDAEKMSAQIDLIRMSLEDGRKRLEILLRGPSRVAGTHRDGEGAGGGGAPIGAGQGIAPSQILGGQPGI